jgi:hypothetical protein
MSRYYGKARKLRNYERPCRDCLPAAHGNRVQVQQVVLNFPLNVVDTMELCSAHDRARKFCADRTKVQYRRISISRSLNLESNQCA